MNYWVAATAFVAVLTWFIAAGSHSAGISSFPVSKHGPIGYHGPLAKPVVQKDGHLADTLEVAAARGEHLLAVAKAHSTSGYGSGDDYGSSDHGNSLYDPGYEGALHGIYSHGPTTGDIYKGEYGYAGLQSFSTDHSYDHGSSGADFGGQSGGSGSESAGYGGGDISYGSGHDSGSAYHQESAGADFGGQAAEYGSESAGYAGGDVSYGSGHDAGSAYHGPLAAPVVLKSGYQADTHDVAAAKGAHYVALSLASQHEGHH